MKSGKFTKLLAMLTVLALVCAILYILLLSDRNVSKTKMLLLQSLEAEKN